MKKNHVRKISNNFIKSFEFWFLFLVRIATTEKFGKEFEEF